MKHEIAEPLIDRAATCRRITDAIVRRGLAKVSRRRSGERKVRRNDRGVRVIKREEGAARYYAGSERRSASDRPAASGRVTRGLGIVAHRWSTSIAASYRASRRAL